MSEVRHGRSPVREALRHRFPRLAPVAGSILSPLFALKFHFQPQPDRRILNDVILPAILANLEYRRILFVGCAWYTRHYGEQFSERDFSTIDVDERVKKFGSQHHVVGSMTELSRHFGMGSLDVLICNGVLGFGLDTVDGAEQAFREAYLCLRPGGLLVIGWDDVDGFRPVHLDDLASIRCFVPHVFPPFTSWRYPTFSRLRHTFDFYLRPDDSETVRVAPSTS